MQRPLISRHLGDFIGVHPLLVLAQLGWFALFMLFFAAHLRGPGPISGFVIAVIVARNGLMFGSYYGALYAVFHLIPFTRDRLWRFKINPAAPRLVRAEARRSMISWLIAAGYEVAIYCAIASGTITLRAAQFDVATIVTTIALMIWADLHFFATHRLLHQKWLYRRVHYVHHLSLNPNAWSTFSFHPVEAAVYFSAMLIVLVVPVSVFHIVLLKIALDYTGAYGHLGFGSFFGGSRFHYLHHKQHRVNYGASVFWDLWFGSAATNGIDDKTLITRQRR